MISLDVINMYANIPPDECINILRCHLQNTQLTNTEINSYCNLTKIVLKQNYFVYNNEFYEQSEGLPMGGPLSGYMANLFMDRFETEHILNKFQNVHYYRRYVDDVFCILNQNNDFKPKI